MKRVRVLRSAVLDASAASDWYAEHDADAAERFRIALDEAVEAIARLPGIGHPWPGEPSLRRVRLRRFPYWVVYEESAAGITVIAVAHSKRKPVYWREP